MSKVASKRVVDLFAGCGGLTLGFQNQGFQVVAGADNWKTAIDIYKNNFSHDIFPIDLSDIEKSVKVFKDFEADIIIGGPPCQDFSQAGKRDETLGRGNLTYSFSRIIEEIKPQYFVMENVDQLVKKDVYKESIKLLKSRGYGITVQLLDASLCGVPQKRKRYFVIGEVNGEDNFLDDFLLNNLASKPMTVRDYLGTTLGTEYYYRHPRSYARRGIYSIDEPSATIRSVNRPIPKGYPGHHLDATSNLELVRPLTTKERSLIQTFPETFKWVDGSKTNIELAIANAVPVKLAEYVASALRQHIEGNSTKYKQMSLFSITAF